MPNRTDYSKPSKSRNHQTIGFSMKPDEIKRAKKLLYETCFVLNQKIKDEETNIVNIAESKGIRITLGKKMRMSQQHLLLGMLEDFYEEKDIAERYKAIAEKK